MKFGFIFIFCALFISWESSANSFLDRDVDDLFKGASDVLEGKVIGIKAECDKMGCTSEIKIEVEKAYKGGGAPGAAEKFCSAAPLSIGFSYIFFVESASEKAGRATCSGVVERDGVFSRFDDAVYRYMSPGSFKMAEIGRDQYLTGWILIKGFDEVVVSERK